MSDYENVKELMTFEKTLIESVLSSDGQTNKVIFQIQNHPHRYFEREGNTIYHGLNILTHVKGYAVSFWIGIDITSKGSKNIMMYFDNVCNNETHIEALKKHGKWTYSESSTVTDGFRLVLKKEHTARILSAKTDAKDLLLGFLNEPIAVL
jgi:hypothetical protein